MKLHKLTVLCVLFLATVTGCRKGAGPAPDPLRNAYGAEPDWNDAQHMVALNYQQAQGQRVFYHDCVWCHADSTPAGPSNRSNLNPLPPLGNDGTSLNAESDSYLENVIALGGSAMGKSGLMPPYNRTLTPQQIHDVVAFLRAIAQPPYQPPARPGPGIPAR